MKNTCSKVVVPLSMVFFLLATVVFNAAAKEPKGKHGEHDARDTHVAGSEKSAKAAPFVLHLNQITTQAQADALQPGDFMSMACAMCKSVMVQEVTDDKAHVKMMTVGEKLTCHSCGGSVEVVATGKGEGKNAEVKHVCSKCGDDAMFCTATTPGSGTMKSMKKMKR